MRSPADADARLLRSFAPHDFASSLVYLIGFRDWAYRRRAVDWIFFRDRSTTRAPSANTACGSRSSGMRAMFASRSAISGSSTWPWARSRPSVRDRHPEGVPTRSAPVVDRVGRHRLRPVVLILEGVHRPRLRRDERGDVLRGSDSSRCPALRWQLLHESRLCVRRGASLGVSVNSR